MPFANNNSLDPVEITATSNVVCIVSGGLDSVCTAAYLRKEKNCTLYFLSYIYGQRARNEIHAAKQFARILKVKDHRTIDIGFMKELYSDTNVLTDTKQTLPGSFNYSIVVPIRNVVFITIASAWAMSLNATVVAYGAHEGDNHYPDCRPEFIRSVTAVPESSRRGRYRTRDETKSNSMGTSSSRDEQNRTLEDRIFNIGRQSI